jgi:hypothetical protein
MILVEHTLPHSFSCITHLIFSDEIRLIETYTPIYFSCTFTGKLKKNSDHPANSVEFALSIYSSMPT